MKIPTYTAGKLASEVTGVNSLDKSGQIIAGAATDFAGNAFQVAGEMKHVREQIETNSAQAQYSLRMARAEAEILKTPGVKSSDVEAAYQQQSQTIKSDLLASISDGATRQAVDQSLQNTELQYQLRAVQQKSALYTKEAYSKEFQTTEDLTSAPFVDIATYKAQEDLIRSQKASYLNLVDTPESADRIIMNALDKKAEIAIESAIDNGTEAEAYAAFNQGAFDSVSTETKERLGGLITEAMATKSYRAELKTQAQILAQNIDLSAQYSAMSMVELSHKESELRFQLDEGTRNGSLSAKQIQDMSRGLKYVETFKSSKLNMAYLQARDNPNRKMELMGKLAGIIKGSGTSAKARPEAVMEDFNALQDELLKAFVEEGSISRRTFEEYSESLTGAMAKGFTDEVYAGRWTDLWKGPEGVRKWFTPDSQKGVSAIFNALKDKTGKTDDAQLMYAIDEYLDDKRENKTLTMTPELAKDYARRGWLKQNGYGSNFKPGDTLNVKGMGPRKITSIDDMGRPNFEITPEEAAKINQIKMRKSNAGN